jgi:uracil-DNA glycosylase
MPTKTTYRFPFGEPVRKVEQKDRSPKKVFVLGVYASAVHARWRGPDNKVLVRALAVASEPEIFWSGEGADKIIKRIKLPDGIGKLEVAAEQYNGPSSRVLDSHILEPLGLKRNDAWLCDCVPQSRVNPSQFAAVQKHYQPLVEKGIVQPATVPPAKAIDETRRAAILRELEDSGAKRIILLGDLPIKWFLKHYVKEWSSLAAIVKKHGYGNPIPVTINGRKYEVRPLTHPRQVARLGRSSQTWFDMHAKWMSNLRRQSVE